MEIHSLQPAILPIIAVGKQGPFIHIGSSFIIASSPREALIVSANHVLEHARRLDDPPLHHVSALPEFLPVRKLPYRMKTMQIRAIVAQAPDSVHFARMGAAYALAGTDLALVCISFGDEVPMSVSFPGALGIDTSLPLVGTVVLAAGYGDTETQEAEDGTHVQFTARLDNREGRVVELYPEGYELLRLGPSFRVSVPISSGMSGGPIMRKVDGMAIACGVNTSDEKTQDLLASGQASIAQSLSPLRRAAISMRDGLESPPRQVTFDELVRRRAVNDLSTRTYSRTEDPRI